MLVLVCLLVIGTPEKLSDTAEWKSFRAVLAKRSSWRVMSINKQRLGEQFEFGANAKGAKYGLSSKKSYIWDGKTGVAMDHRKKTWRTLSLTGDSEQFYEDLTPFIFQDAEGKCSRLSWHSATGKLEKLGWNVKYQGRDYEFETTVWFDVNTHLMVNISKTGNGMVATSGYEGSYDLYWQFDGIDPSVWQAKPIAGYKKS